MITWLIGMSGAGKSTIGREVYLRLKRDEKQTVFIDGDEIRSVFKHDNLESSFNLDERRKNAERIVEICKWLDNQDIEVICCILCVFPDILKSNKNIYNKYMEVFVSAPLDILMMRDTKGLYKAGRKGTIKNVVGVDISFPEPESPDLVLDSSGESGNYQVLAKKVLALIKAKKDNNFIDYKYSDEGILENRNNYFYSKYEGRSFIKGWSRSRLTNQYSKTAYVKSEYNLPYFEGNSLLDRLYNEVNSKKYSDELKLLLKRFEVGKRIYAEYHDDLRPVNSNNYKDIFLYLKFAEILNIAYEESSELYYLNALLKVMDIVVSEKNNLSKEESKWLSILAVEENKHISNLGQSLGIKI